MKFYACRNCRRYSFPYKDGIFTVLIRPPPKSSCGAHLRPFPARVVGLTLSPLNADQPNPHQQFPNAPTALGRHATDSAGPVIASPLSSTFRPSCSPDISPPVAAPTLTSLGRPKRYYSNPLFVFR
ncbi:hypothetical protein COLO4_19672 [Corchorus olitorius]|uniref:Uncharacterized protein n=1 Tax=Corchorus olitorius TaxID=93759 RepID=A0A1R3J479_9ROSI|nr:hypothetical protein COLO4_19672 [Corchorus olitorius]